MATDLVRCDAVLPTSDMYTLIFMPCFLRSPGLGASSRTSSISPVPGSAFVRHGDDPNYGPRRAPLHPPNGLVLPVICGGLCKTGCVGASDSDLHLREDNDRAGVIVARATSARSNAASGPNTSASQAPPSSASARQPFTNLCGRISAGNSEVCPELTKILQNGNNVLRRKRCGRRRGPRCDKGNPAARRVRKATDLQEVAGLPNRGRTCAATPGFWQPPRLHC
jgi:hypothetical protein